MNDIEEEIQKKGLTAPRVTPERLDEVIVSEQYHVFPNTTFTACLLTLANGYTVLGESACASPENFNADLGRKIARDNAKNKIWSLEGYLLRQSLSENLKLNAAEALYGFSGWLSSRQEKVEVGPFEDASVIADLVAQFCKENSLTEPREGWANNLIHPTGECSGAA